MFLVRFICGVLLFVLPASNLLAQALPSAFTVVHRFSYVDLETPAGKLVQAEDGTFYGVLETGGLNGGGAIFSLAANAQFQILYSFGLPYFPIANDHGSLPVAGLIFGPDGNLYGTTYDGGPTLGGTVFRMTPTGELTTLASFGAAGQGQGPSSPLFLASDGFLYGTTYTGDQSAGTIYRIDPTTGTVQTVFEFPLDGSLGSSLTAGLLEGKDGALYGTTNGSGGTPQGGSRVFRWPLGGQATSLASFPGIMNNTMGSLVNDSDGTLYGVSAYGAAGAAGGFVYKTTLDGVVTQLHIFDCSCGIPEGAYPTGSLLLASDGNFYGVTSGGGIYNNGVIFQMTPSGVVTTMHSFTDDEGDMPVGGLIEGQDGRLYGMTSGFFEHTPTLFKLALIPATSATLQVTAAVQAVNLSWAAVKGASTYSLYQGTSSGAQSSTAVLTGITSTSATVSNLQAGTTYYFLVRAINEAGEGAASPEASATPSSNPASGGGGGMLELPLLFCLITIAFIFHFRPKSHADCRSHHCRSTEG